MAKIDDDASRWYESVGMDLQDYEAPDAPPPLPENPEGDIDELRPYGDVPEVTNDDVRNVTNMRAISEPTAEVIVGTLDVVIPLFITLLIKHSDKDDCKLSEEERRTLVGAWATYLGDKNVQLSPGVSLLMAMGTIYGAKVVGALTCAKERSEIARQREEINRLRERLATAEKEKDAALALSSAAKGDPNE